MTILHLRLKVRIWPKADELEGRAWFRITKVRADRYSGLFRNTVSCR